MAGGPLRHHRILEHELNGETVVYALDRDTAHVLNATTTAVFRRCDGTRTAADIAAVLPADVGREASLEIVLAALDELAGAGLLAPGTHPALRAPLSRRAALRKIGVTATLVPTILTVVAPPPAAAQSSARLQACGAEGDACTDVPCCSGLTCSDGVCVAEEPPDLRDGPPLACVEAGEVCAHDTECCDGLYCDSTTMTCSENPLDALEEQHVQEGVEVPDAELHPTPDAPTASAVEEAPVGAPASGPATPPSGLSPVEGDGAPGAPMPAAPPPAPSPAASAPSPPPPAPPPPPPAAPPPPPPPPPAAPPPPPPPPTATPT